MKISLEWLRDYVSIPAEHSVQRVAHDLTMCTVEVEGTVELHRALDHVVVGKIRELRSVAGDRALQVASCDLGSERVTVVSDAGNLAIGQLVAVALPGAQIHSSADAATRRVAVRELGGISSEGVICTPGHLGLTALFSARVLSDAVDLSELEVAPGEPLAPAIGWGDTVLEIDNKSLTNRPDLWGHYGIARELAAIYRLPLRPLPQVPEHGAPQALVDRDFDPAICRRFYAARIATGPMVQSPLWLRSRLARVGQQPRNLLVDLTNYVMLTVGQPSHVYDAAKLKLPLRVRQAGAGEKVRLLDGKEYVLQASMPVIADGNGSVGAAGLMGGADSAVDESTREVVLEMANFEALAIRRMATALGLRTEASSRFEKALDTMRIDAGRALFFDLLTRIRPSARVAGYADEHPRPTQPVRIEVAVDFLLKRLGMPMERAEIESRLQSVGFTVQGTPSLLQVTVPSWRATGDVALPQDILEEVARLHGYENFRYVEPRVGLRRIAQPSRNPLDRQLRLLCARVGGLQEVVSYPWATDAMLEAVGLADAAHLCLATPPAPDKRWLRPSLVPGIVERVVENLRYSAGFGIFELGRVFPRAGMAPLDDRRESLPAQPLQLAGALVGANAEELFVVAKGLMEDIGRALRLPGLHFSADARPPWGDAKAGVAILYGGDRAGSIGILSARTRRLAGIRRAVVAVFELFVESLAASAGQQPVMYQPVPEYPEVSIDLSLIFRGATPWMQIEHRLQGLHPLVRSVTFVDQFRGRGIPPLHKSITLRLRLGSPVRTLRSEEVAEVAALASDVLQQAFGAQMRQADAQGAGVDAG